MAVLAMLGGSASAQPIGLGTAQTFAVLAGTTVTNTGPSVIGGDVGVSPGTEVVGFPPGNVIGGTIYRATAEAAAAQAALTTAYLETAGRTPCTPLPSELGNQRLGPGVYCAGTFQITGTLTLVGDADDVFIFQAGSTLVTAPDSIVMLEGGAQACNVFWQVGSSATIGLRTRFVGTILALTTIIAETGATIQGRLLARNGAVTLDTNTITVPVCAIAPTTTSTVPATTTSTIPATTTTMPGATTTTVPATTTTVPATTTTTAPGASTPDATPTPGAATTTTITTSAGAGTPAVPAGAAETVSGTTSTATRSKAALLAVTGISLGALAIAGLLAVVLGGLMSQVSPRRGPRGSTRWTRTQRPVTRVLPPRVWVRLSRSWSLSPASRKWMKGRRSTMRRLRSIRPRAPRRSLGP